MSYWKWFIIHLLEFNVKCRYLFSLCFKPKEKLDFSTNTFFFQMAIRYVACHNVLKILHYNKATSYRRKFQPYVSNTRWSLRGPLFCYNGFWMLNDWSVNFIHRSVNFIHFDTTKLNPAVCRCLIQLNVCFWNDKGHHGPVFILFDSLIYQSSPFLSFSCQWLILFTYKFTIWFHGLRKISVVLSKACLIFGYSIGSVSLYTSTIDILYFVFKTTIAACILWFMAASPVLHTMETC